MYKHPTPYRLLGRSVGNGECAAIAQAGVPGLVPLPVPGSHPQRYYPRVSDWVRGHRVKGYHLPIGTVIATFDSNGCYVGQAHFHYQGTGLAHTALYLGQSKAGIEVIHQYAHHPARKALILFGGGKRRDACYADGYQSAGVSHRGLSVEDDADNYYVVELRPTPALQNRAGTPNPEDFAVHVSGSIAPKL
jgi:hypothetical protein